jgi:thioredoxin-related protein
MNPNDEDARKVFDEYKCKGVPHLLFVDEKGDEVDRIIGYLPPSEYLARIQDIRNNKHTLDDYISQYENGQADAELIAGIAMKYVTLIIPRSFIQSSLRITRNQPQSIINGVHFF